MGFFKEAAAVFCRQHAVCTNWKIGSRCMSFKWEEMWGTAEGNGRTRSHCTKSFSSVWRTDSSPSWYLIAPCFPGNHLLLSSSKIQHFFQCLWLHHPPFLTSDTREPIGWVHKRVSVFVSSLDVSSSIMTSLILYMILTRFYHCPFLYPLVLSTCLLQNISMFNRLPNVMYLRIKLSYSGQLSDSFVCV